MRNFKFAIILLVLLFSFSAFAADEYNNNVRWVEGETWILYYDTLQFAADSTASHYTKAMDVINANDAVGSIRAWCTDVTGTEDVNISVHYNNDLDFTYFTESTIDVIDQVQTSAKVDSLGDDDQFKQHRWLVLEADGQTGNPAATICYWFVLVKKRAGTPKKCAGAKSTT